jgi:hypothetical protein
MKLHGFVDELIQIRPSGSLVKMASTGALLGRMAALGAMIGLGQQGLGYARSVAMNDPYAIPQQSGLSSAAQGAMGGLAAGAAMAALKKMFK